MTTPENQSDQTISQDISLQDRAKPFRAENLIFVGGSPRSGTTLVQRMLGAHPDIYGGPEFDLMPAISDLFQQHLDLIENGRISRIIDPQQAAEAFRDLLHSLFKHKASEQGVSYISEKSPANCLIFNQLEAIVPGSKKIMVLRDPRDILASMLAVAQRYREAGDPVPKTIRTAASCAHTIGDHQQQGIQSSEQLDNVLVLHYEDILGDPAQACQTLCDFLGIEYSNAMINLEGKAIEGAVGDDQKWYSAAALSSGINTEKKQASVNVYHDYLLRKYTPVNHPLMQRYQLPAPAFKPVHIFYAVKEFLTFKKHDRRRVQHRLRGRKNAS